MPLVFACAYLNRRRAIAWLQSDVAFVLPDPDQLSRFNLGVPPSDGRVGAGNSNWSIEPAGRLTEPARNAAMHLLQCECVMSEIVEVILKTSGRIDLDAQSRAKIIRYFETLKSAGNRDEKQLAIFGLAYLEQLLNPDPRYSGC